MKFIPGFEPDPSADGKSCLVFTEKERALVVNPSGNPVHDHRVLKDLLRTEQREDEIHLGTLEGKNLSAFSLKGREELPEGLEWTDFIAVYRDTGHTDQYPLSRGKQLLEWNRTHRFCGACGTETLLSDSENARRCPDCGELWFPVIAPAIITRITRGDEILLAHNANFPEGLYSHIAGFADPGESLEQTIRREVREEVGLEVENIRFFGSQSWPMPHSLMMGFTAECTDPLAQPVPDGVEIHDARWFTKDSLPSIPSTGSIAGRMLIDYIGKGE
ncbi:MAG: NAD(+) diphosphatase [Spirochaetales bacterium]|nr:NAD(+) diphosphatase [Spirochaetales bacterium]